jgi:predicted MFS family arabinose efflux permease
MTPIGIRLRTPAGRGFVMIMVATVAAGFAMAAQGNIVANYFEHILGLSGPEFGYITAIREIPGFLLIFVSALFYRMPLPKLTAGALALLALGYGLFGWSSSLWTVAPWVIISSMGYHTWLQTQYALALSLTTEDHAGRVLGTVAAVASIGSLVAMLVVLLSFQFEWLTYVSTFMLCGLLALVAAIAIFGFPNLRDGQITEEPPRREPIVLRREYRFYYLLNLLDGGRQQILFSFGLWVLVHRFSLGVPAISGVLIGVTALSAVTGRWIGSLIDRYGERPVLAVSNVGYVIVLVGYALADQVWLALGCYMIYSFIFPLSGMGATTYLRKVAAADDMAPSLAMGVTLQHVAAIIVPLATGYILNYVGYQIPFAIAAIFACLTFLVTRRLAPETQKSARRIEEDRAAMLVGTPS